MAWKFSKIIARKNRGKGELKKVIEVTNFDIEQIFGIPY